MLMNYAVRKAVTELICNILIGLVKVWKSIVLSKK